MAGTTRFRTLTAFCRLGSKGRMRVIQACSAGPEEEEHQQAGHHQLPGSSGGSHLTHCGQSLRLFRCDSVRCHLMSIQNILERPSAKVKVCQPKKRLGTGSPPGPLALPRRAQEKLTSNPRLLSFGRARSLGQAYVLETR
jgi:hypothetical protein